MNPDKDTPGTYTVPLQTTPDFLNHAQKCYALKMQIGGNYMQKRGVLCAICRKLGAM